jgi:hypothetical protein
MNPEGRQTPNTNQSIDQRVRKAIEQRDRTKPSLGTQGQTQAANSTPPLTEVQKKLAALKAKYLQTQQQASTAPKPNPPSVSSGLPSTSE